MADWLAYTSCKHFLNQRITIQIKGTITIDVAVTVTINKANNQKRNIYKKKKKKITRVSGATITVNNENAFLYSIDLNELSKRKRDKIMINWFTSGKCLWKKWHVASFTTHPIYMYIWFSRRKQKPPSEHHNIIQIDRHGCDEQIHIISFYIYTYKFSVYGKTYNGATHSNKREEKNVI